MQQFDEDAPSLSDTLAVLRRRWMLIVVAMAVVVAASLGWAEFVKSTAEPDYQATHRLAPAPSRGLSPVALEQMAVVVNEGAVKGLAEAELGDLPGTSVSASADETAGTLNITARGTDAESVAVAADGHAAALNSYLSGQDREARDERVAEQQAAVQAASAALTAAQQALSADPANPQLISDRESASISYQQALGLLQSSQAEQLPEAQFRTLSQARAELSPLGGFPGLGLSRQLGIALILGALLGVACAYIAEALDRRLMTAEAASAAFGVPVIGEVPHGGKEFATGDHFAPPASLVNEAYRRVRTIIELELQGGRATGDDAAVILVTSPGPTEGKTTTVAHVARALGETGHRVLVISADFRRPQLHKYFGVEAARGMAALAERNGPVSREELIQRTDVPGVSLIAAGAGSHDPTELIHYGRRVIAEATKFYDFIIIDTPPLLSASDALNFVPQSNVVLLVSRFNETKRPAAERTRDMLLRVDAPVLGVIMTAVRGGEGYGYYYGQAAATPRSVTPGAVKPALPASG